MSFAEMVERLRKDRLGEDLPADWVPYTMLYAFVDSQIVGRLSIRHELNEYLRKFGGNIGYAVAPRFRGNGYATEILKQALPFCDELGLKKVLIICASQNIASVRLIEKIGAELENEVWDEVDQEMIRRYWWTSKSNP